MRREVRGEGRREEGGGERWRENKEAFLTNISSTNVR